MPSLKVMQAVLPHIRSPEKLREASKPRQPLMQGVLLDFHAVTQLPSSADAAPVALPRLHRISGCFGSLRKEWPGIWLYAVYAASPFPSLADHCRLVQELPKHSRLKILMRRAWPLAARLG